MKAFLIILAIVANAFAGSDPIGALVTGLEEKPFWVNGLWPSIPLPKEANAAEVAKRYFEITSDHKGKIEDFEILEVRKIAFPKQPGDYTAIRCSTNQGGRILLIRFDPTRPGWVARSFDAK